MPFINIEGTQFASSRATPGKEYVPAQLACVDGKYAILFQAKGTGEIVTVPDKGDFGKRMKELGFISEGKTLEFQVARTTGKTSAVHVQVLGVKGNRPYGHSTDTYDTSIVALSASLEPDAKPDPKAILISALKDMLAQIEKG